MVVVISLLSVTLSNSVQRHLNPEYIDVTSYYFLNLSVRGIPLKCSGDEYWSIVRMDGLGICGILIQPWSCPRMNETDAPDIWDHAEIPIKTKIYIDIIYDLSILCIVYFLSYRGKSLRTIPNQLVPEFLLRFVLIVVWKLLWSLFNRDTEHIRSCIGTKYM